MALDRYDVKNKGIEELISVHDSLAVLQNHTQKRKEGNGDEREAAAKFLKQSAVDHYTWATEGKYTGTVDDISDEEVEEALKARGAILNMNRTDLFSYNLDTILSEGEGGIGRKALEVLVSQKEVGENIKDEDAETFVLYREIAKMREFRERYAKHGERVLDEKEAKKISAYAFEGATKDTRKVFKDAGYDEDMQEIAATSTKIAIASGNYDRKDIEKYALDGIDSEIVKLEETYKKASEKRDIYAVVADAVKNIEKQDRGKAMHLVIGSYKSAKVA